MKQCIVCNKQVSEDYVCDNIHCPNTNYDEQIENDYCEGFEEEQVLPIDYQHFENDREYEDDSLNGQEDINET